MYHNFAVFGTNNYDFKVKTTFLNLDNMKLIFFKYVIHKTFLRRKKSTIYSPLIFNKFLRKIIIFLNIIIFFISKIF